jgi:hypothetical protein
MTSLRECLMTFFLLGLDSFVAGAAIGPILASWSARAWLVTAFGVCDGLSTLLGTAAPHLVPDLPSVMIYGIAVALIIQAALRSRTWLYAVPILLSLDNLAAGRPASEALALGLSSAAMAGLGLVLGGLGCRLAVGAAGVRASWASR